MEKLVKIGIFFDYYGKLLSEKQYSAIELYYIYDLSLAEIGENLSITRQAVYDTLKRAETNLEEYEEKLKLVEKAYNNRKIINQIKENIVDIEEIATDDKIKDKSIEIKKLIADMLNDSQEVVT